MSKPFPPELVDSILGNLCGTSSIRECALVCNTWVASARRHLLPQPRILNLDQFQIVDFLALSNSPHSTFSFLSVNTLHLRQNRILYVPPRVDFWSCTAVSEFLEKTLPETLLRVEALILESIDWKTLSPGALVALNTNFTSLKCLSLTWIAISFSEFCNIITNLPNLEKLTIGPGIPFDEPWPVHAAPLRPEHNHPANAAAVQKLVHKTLTRLVFEHRQRSSTIQNICRAFYYAAGIVEVSVEGSWWEFQESAEELFSTAGTSLQVVKLRASHHGPRDMSVNQLSSITLFLSFPHNPNLREIHLRDVNEVVLRELMRGLKSNPKTHLHTLTLGLSQIEFLTMEEWENTWELVDRTLSRPSESLGLAAAAASSSGSLTQAAVPIKNHQIILECSPPRGFGLGGDPNLPEVNSEDVLRTAVGVLPRMAETWTIIVEIRL